VRWPPGVRAHAVIAHRLAFRLARRDSLHRAALSSSREGGAQRNRRMRGAAGLQCGAMSKPEPSEISAGRPRAKRPLSLGAGAVIVHERRVLLVRNRHGVTRGRYLLPAGRVEPDELPDDAAVREAFEETNLRVAIAGLLGVRLWVLDDGEQNYFFMFLATLLSAVGELRPNLAEVDDARWFSSDELAALGSDETWSGAVAIAHKGLDAAASVWPNAGELSDQSGVDTPERWRMWM